MIALKLLLVVVLVFAGIARQECKRGDKKLKKIWLENIDGIFVGEFSLGTPEQKFKVTFDTEKTGFWVVGPDCDSEYCMARKAFNSSESSTFINTNMIERIHYRDTSIIYGFIGSDVMKLSDLTIDQQDFIVAKMTFGFPPLPYDSLLGLAYYGSLNDFFTPLENLGKQNYTKIFSFLSPQGGVLVIGGVEPKYYTGEITYVPLDNEGFWAFYVRSTSIGNVSDLSTLRSDDTLMTIDSAINFIGVPWDDYREIVRRYRPDRKNNVDCSFIKPSETLNIEIGEQTFRVPSDLFISQDKTTNICTLKIYAVEEEYYVLGNPFLQAFYTVFDAEQHRFGIAAKSETFNPKRVNFSKY